MQGPYRSPAWSRQHALAEYALRQCLPLRVIEMEENWPDEVILSDIHVQQTKLDIHEWLTLVRNGILEKERASSHP